ncbi:hypothetical protein AAZV13_08G157800 [Glycine max]
MERRQNQTPQGFWLNFLEVAITAVVFLKGVYPSGAFERRRYMNVVIQRALHRQLRYYMHATVSGLLPSMQKLGMVERVAVIFFNADNVPLEKFVFKLTMNQTNNLNRLKLSVCPLRCQVNKASLTYAGTSKEADLSIPTDTKPGQQPPLITPIKSMSSEPLNLQLYLEHPSLLESLL